jgi:hypothetical protein
MSDNVSVLPLAAAIAAVVVLAPGVSAAQATPTTHAHAAHGKLTLDHGRKWPTDDALRVGMNNIRALVQPQLGPIHTGKLDAAQYAALANGIERQIGDIVANCKLEPKADAMLHLVIADLGAGVDAMAGKSPSVQPFQGATTVVAALDDYGRYFDHPGFKPIHVDH